MKNELEGILLGGIPKDEMFIMNCNRASVNHYTLTKTEKQTHPPKQYNNKKQKKW